MDLTGVLHIFWLSQDCTLSCLTAFSKRREEAKLERWVMVMKEACWAGKGWAFVVTGDIFQAMSSTPWRSWLPKFPWP